MRTIGNVVVTFGLFFTLQAISQEAPKDAKDAPPAPGGTVSGRVVFADTNGPARFAKVLLKSVAPPSGTDDLTSLFGGDDTPAKSKAGVAPKKKLSAEDEAEAKQTKAASAKFMSAISDMLVATTIGADGQYVFTNVKAGTYYVHAMAPGYIDPLAQFSADDLTSTDPAMRQKIAAVATPITVSGTDQVRADLRIARGASISGRVLYDDGTAAVGWTVRTVHEPPPGSVPTGGTFGAMGIDLNELDIAHASEASVTDDTGHFRIVGLPSGSFKLQARFTAPALGHSSFNPIGSSGAGGMAAMMGLKLTVYSGNAVRKAEAKAVEVRAGDERSGYDLTMPMHLMHSISGQVLSKADGHGVNGGTVELTQQDPQGRDDSSTHQIATIQPDGSFHFDYIPGQATYTIKANHAVDATTLSVKKLFGSNIAEQKTTRSYGPATVTTALGDSDVTDVRVVVPELPAGD